MTTSREYKALTIKDRIIEFRVKKDTDIKALAFAIYTNIKNVNKIKLECIGVCAVNQ